MSFKVRENHTVDVLFSVALFCIFSISAIAVILTGARVYSQTQADSTNDYNLRTSLSYINEKIRQADSEAAISVSTLDGLPALVLLQTADNVSYRTYVYMYEEQLMELSARTDARLHPQSGTVIMAVSDFSMTEISDGLLQFTVTDEQGDAFSILIHPSAKQQEVSDET